MGDAPCHAADGDHFLVVLEPGHQLGFGGAVFVQIPVCLLDTVEHLVQPAGDAGDLIRAFQGGAVGQVAPGDPLHMCQQLIHVATDPTIMAEQHPGQNDQAEQAPDQPGDDGQLLQGMAEITGAPGDLDQSLDLPGGIEQRQEVGKQAAPGDPAEGFLAFTGGADAIRDGGAGEVGLGDAGRSDAVAVHIEYRGAVDLAQHEHRAQGQFHRLHIALVQCGAHRNADGAADQFQVIFQPLFLKLAGLAQAEADTQRTEQHNG